MWVCVCLSVWSSLLKWPTGATSYQQFEILFLQWCWLTQWLALEINILHHFLGPSDCLPFISQHTVCTLVAPFSIPYLSHCDVTLAKFIQGRLSYTYNARHHHLRFYSLVKLNTVMIYCNMDLEQVFASSSPLTLVMVYLWRLVLHHGQCYFPENCPCTWLGLEYLPGETVETPCYKWYALQCPFLTFP